MDGIVIVGGGLATARCVKSYREEGGTDPLRVLSSDSAYPYFRPPLSKRYLRGEIEAEDTLVEAPEFYAAHDCAVELETTVVSIGDREVRIEPGTRVPFDRLVLASGATPRHLDVPGADLDGVFTLRTLANATAIRERAAQAERAVVTGPNFIGLETTASLTQRGVRVTLVVRGDALFPALAVPAFSRFLDDLYREHGVELLYGDAVGEITGEEGRIATVKTTGGEEREADILIAGIGVAPKTSFLQGAGLDVDDGAVVNERFETSRPDVWAIGDVARFFDPVYGRHRRIEHASNASYQGTELGKVLAGTGPGYDQVSLFFSEVFGVGVRFLGDHTGHDGLVEHGDFHDGNAVTLHTAGGRIVAALAMGQEDDVLERLKALIREQAPAGDFVFGG
jgi:3-phenylpropionate/trans-cinnamate dioxygenase ferredoxin reductase component